MAININIYFDKDNYSNQIQITGCPKSQEKLKLTTKSCDIMLIYI